MEKLSSGQHSFPVYFLIILGFVEFFLSQIIPNWVGRTIFNLFTKSYLSIQFPVGVFDNFKEKLVEKGDQDSDESPEKKSKSGEKEERDDGISLEREEVEMVMGKLGFFCQPEHVKIQERFGSDEFEHLFEEKEPSLEEIKEAFDVFDENRDGFIDAMELQRVVGTLRLKEEATMESCEKMISVFDENGDGRIDFNEFLKLMEKSSY